MSDGLAVYYAGTYAYAYVHYANSMAVRFRTFCFILVALPILALDRQTYPSANHA